MHEETSKNAYPCQNFSKFLKTMVSVMLISPLDLSKTIERRKLLYVITVFFFGYSSSPFFKTRNEWKKFINDTSNSFVSYIQKPEIKLHA